MGDLVFLKLRPYRQRTLAKGPFEKLCPSFYGPFHVSARVGQVAYRLELPPGAAIHPVLHVSQLKRAIGSATAEPNFPAKLTADLEMCVRPEEVLSLRQGKGGPGNQLEVLIKWHGLPTHKSTWESYD